MDVHSPADAPAPGTLNPPLLRTLVVCDIADSTALVEKLGDQQAAQLVRKHDRLARALLEQQHGREIDKTDGFLLLFERPIHAVAFALDYQRGLKHLSAAEGVVVRARVGIHMGDVVVWENSPEDVARGAKPIEIEGLAKPMAARLAQLAQPRQILLTAAAASIAHRAHGELGDCAAHVRWRALGRYLFKGLPEAVEVHEVGEESVATFRAPRGSRTAKRILPWWRRPAVLAAEAAMLAVAIAIPAWLSTRSEPALAFAARDWVVVGDLQNLTGNSSFDQSVETALRISLEQSRYVNVLPELKVQETLQRMERDPAKTVVDRGVGSEIAMRDGARALVLPTLAEVNGKLRVTAEVIDPNSQATVYSISAEGNGTNSVLPSLDKIGRDLRSRLGETLASIQTSWLPLEKVSTSNLDALRAFSLGNRAYNKGDMKDAAALYAQAINFDPGFALAHIGLVRVYASDGENQQALHEAQAAARLRDRLQPRDALYTDAWLETFDAPLVALEKWKLLASLYPDFYVGLGTYSFFSWRVANNYDDAIKAAEAAAVPSNPHRSISQFFLGNLYLGKERYGDALKSYQAAMDAGITRTEYMASAYAATRNFSAAQTWLARAKPSGMAAGDMDAYINRIAISGDEGNLGAAMDALKGLKSRADASDSRLSTQIAAIDLSLRALSDGKDDYSLQLRRYVQAVHEALAREPEVNRSDNRFRLALGAYLAAKVGDVKLAEQTLKDVSAGADNDIPATHNMLVVARAQIAVSTGRAGDAIKELYALVNGSELFVTHVALMDAYAANQDFISALRESEWIASHRGRAYSEYSVQWIMTPFNVVQSDLAHFRAAEFSAARSDAIGARMHLAAFVQAWPNAKDQAFLKARFTKLSDALR